MEPYSLLVLLVFFITAFMYASVGHGGASGYLGLLALIGVTPVTTKISALILNLLVSFLAFSLYYKKGYFRWKLFYPFALASVPFAFFGSYTGIDPFWYKKLLALCLAIACVRLFGLIRVKEPENEPTVPILPALIAGAVIGLLSGMIGIGGGIILSPLILLLGWGRLKETAAASALFIFVNSFSGLLAVPTGIIASNVMPALIAAVFGGGLAGAYWGSIKAQPSRLKLALGVVIVFAALKLLMI